MQFSSLSAVFKNVLTVRLTKKACFERENRIVDGHKQTVRYIFGASGHGEAGTINKVHSKGVARRQLPERRAHCARPFSIFRNKGEENSLGNHDPHNFRQKHGKKQIEGHLPLAPKVTAMKRLRQPWGILCSCYDELTPEEREGLFGEHDGLISEDAWDFQDGHLVTN